MALSVVYFQFMLLQDRHVKVSVIAHELGISTDTLFSIILQSWWWVSRILTPGQKACRPQFSEENLDMLRANIETSSRELLQKMKHGSIVMIQRPNKSPCNRKHKGSSSPNKFRVQQSAWKIMATVFWDSEGVLNLEFMPQKTTITETPMLQQSWLYARMSNINAVESCRLVSCCFITIQSHTSHAHRVLL